MMPALTFLLGVTVFVAGLYKWRRDLRAKRLIELCEEVLAALYEVEDAFPYIRNSALSGGELSAREPKPDESKEEAGARKEAYVYYHRYERRRECFQKLRSLKYRFMAVFGRDYESPFIEIQDTINKVLCAAATRRELQVSRDEDDSELVQLQEWMWMDYGSKDPVNDKLKVPIQQIEHKCREEITGQASIVYPFWRNWI